jgi:hypothetical protein
VVFARERASWRLAVCLSMLGLVSVPTTADACTCVTSLNCRGVVSADAVFEATVEATELGVRSASPPAALPSGAASSSWLSNDVRIVTLRDLRMLRGEGSATVVTAPSGDACGYEFKAGTRYLVVAHRLPDGRLAVTRCGPTRPLSEANGLLEYIQTFKGPATQTRVWGQVKMPVGWVDFGREVDPVPEARVTANGPQRRSVLTGADGRYSMADLPHGLYTLSVAWPGARPELDDVQPESFVLDMGAAYACAEVDFVAPIKSAISGVILDEGGRPLSGADVQLGLADQLDRSRGAAGAGTTTDTLGRFRFSGLPPGRYLVGLNISSGGPSPGTPFAVTYAKTTAGETVISLPLAGTITLAPIRARRLAQITVAATVREPDGTSAPGVDVTAAMFGEYGRIYPMFPVKTDGEGRLQLRLWQGERYRLTIGSRFNPDAEMEVIATDKPLSITLRGR